MENKIYVGNGKKKTFDNGGSITSMMIDLDDLESYFNDFGFTTEQGKRKMKLKLCSKKETDQYGNTHYVVIDTWKPDNQNQDNDAQYQNHQANQEFGDQNSYQSYQSQNENPEPKQQKFESFNPNKNKPAADNFDSPGFDDDDIPF